MIGGSTCEDAAVRWGDSGLDAAQVAFVERVLPGSVVVTDDSWGLLDTRVLHVRSSHGDHTVKACGPDNTHFPRELLAHRSWTGELVRHGDTAPLMHADVEARVLVIDRIPGRLALGNDDETSSDLHRQAGRILRRFHDQTAITDPDHLAVETAKALRLLDAPHRIDSATVRRVRSLLRSAEPHPVTVVPTHGDWHPRNWIVHEDRLHVIDFGRFALRPAATDLTRLAVLYWERKPRLEQAFIEGYGDDPREADDWRWLQLREAVGTAVWAFAVGDPAFEAQGQRMLRAALSAF